MPRRLHIEGTFRRPRRGKSVNFTSLASASRSELTAPQIGTAAAKTLMAAHYVVGRYASHRYAYYVYARRVDWIGRHDVADEAHEGLFSVSDSAGTGAPDMNPRGSALVGCPRFFLTLGKMTKAG